MYRSPLAVTPSRLKVVFPHSFKSTKSCTVQAHNFKHCEHLPASSQRETRCSTARWRHLLDSSLQTHRFTHKTVNIKSVSTSLELRSRSVAARRNAATHRVSEAGNLSCSVLLILLCTTSLSKRKGWLGKKMNKSIQKCKVLLAMVQDGWWTFSLRSERKGITLKSFGGKYYYRCLGMRTKISGTKDSSLQILLTLNYYYYYFCTQKSWKMWSENPEELLICVVAVGAPVSFCHFILFPSHLRWGRWI